MKIWQLSSTGRNNLQQEERPIPTSGPDEIVLRVEAFSLNYRDKAIIEGTYPIPMRMPLIPGSDAAGKVVSAGHNVRNFAVGDLVMTRLHVLWTEGKASNEATTTTLGGPLDGVFAEYVVVNQAGVIEVPSYLNAEQACTLPIAALTAWVALFRHAQLQHGNDVLVQGSGGVSIFALQFARAAGNRVIGVSRSKEKAQRLIEMGASEVIDSNKYRDWENRVRELTGGKGVEVTIDVIGGDSLQRSIAASTFEGHIAVIGFVESMAATIAIPWMLGNNVSLQGCSVGSRADFRELLSFMEEHKIEPVIEATYPFADLPLALEHLDRSPFGKIVVKVEQASD